MYMYLELQDGFCKFYFCGQTCQWDNILNYFSPFDIQEIYESADKVVVLQWKTLL